MTINAAGPGCAARWWHGQRTGSGSGPAAVVQCGREGARFLPHRSASKPVRATRSCRNAGGTSSARPCGPSWSPHGLRRMLFGVESGMVAMHEAEGNPSGVRVVFAPVDSRRWEPDVTMSTSRRAAAAQMASGLLEHLGLLAIAPASARRDLGCVASLLDGRVPWLNRSLSARAERARSGCSTHECHTAPGIQTSW